MTILEILSVYKEGNKCVDTVTRAMYVAKKKKNNNAFNNLGLPYLSLFPSSLWSVLTELEFEAAVLIDHRYIALEILTKIFRNSKVK